MKAAHPEPLGLPEPPLPWQHLIVVKQTVHLLATARELWPLITDTERMNRAIGMGAVSFNPLNTVGTAARFWAQTRVAGFVLEYEEDPFEWVNEQRFSVVRRLRRGPVKGYRFSVTLFPQNSGTTVQIGLELAPAHPWLALVMRQLGKRLVAQITRYIREGSTRDIRPTLNTAHQADGQRVAAGVRNLVTSGVAKTTAEALGDLLQRGDDVEMTRIRPFECADRWQTDRREVLAAMLQGVGAGLLELRWSLICPSCLVPAMTAETLEDIPSPGHCQFCDLTFGVELDRAVEATFVPHPAVRQVEFKPFCIGGPGRTPHVLAQKVAGAHGPVDFEMPREPGRYRIFVRGGAAASVEVDTEAKISGRQKLVFSAEGLTPVYLSVLPGTTLVVHNGTSEPRHVKVERIPFAAAAATAAIVSNMPAFRRFFSKDLLKPATPMKVLRVSLLFSDLTGSTALYTQVGDAAAFRFVDDHFDAVRGAIEAQKGIVVKTMGDAVMASFLTSDAAVVGAHNALVAFQDFTANRGYADAVGLKVGLFSGACYVVTANGILDYFGQTVNLAARLQALAGSGELVLVKEEYEALAEDTQRLFCIVKEQEKKVKGIDESLWVLHLMPKGHL